MKRTAGRTPESRDAVAAVESWRSDGFRLSVRTQTISGRAVDLEFSAPRRDVWRVSVVPAGAPAVAATPIIVLRPGKGVGLEVRENQGIIRAAGPKLTLEITCKPWRLRFLDSAGREVLADNPGDVDGLGRPSVPAIGPVARSGRLSGLTAAFSLAPDERLYGLGEKFTPLDKAGQRIISWTCDALGSTSERSHKNIPFLWSTRGWGLLLDTGARIIWDLGADSTQTWAFEAEIPRVDMYVIHGPEPARILGAYQRLTGRAPVPPKWTFGLWLSSGGTYRDQKSIERLLDGIEKHELPAGVIHIDPWWMRWRKYCDFEWDRRAFPDPAGLIDKIHGLGLKVCLWEHPYISVESRLFTAGKSKGYFVKRPDGGVYVIDYGLSLAPRPDGAVRVADPKHTWNAPVAIIDLTNPEAAAWFQDLHRPLLRMGVDVFKTDFGEDIPADAVFHNGETGGTMHNLYPLLYNRAVFEVVEQEKGRGFVWSRSGTAGSQRYPAGWSGDPACDFPSLAATIRGGLSAGLSGLPFWSNDIGGYRGTPDPELYIRWAQFGLFCSHSRMHGDSPREPWIFGPKALRIVRAYARLRYRFFPYIYSTAHEASRTGLPVLRALPLAFPDDPNAASWEFEYMFGPWFLVAPVFERSTDGRKVRSRIYLPPGRWVDYHTLRMTEGPAVVERNVRLDTLPLFVRAGAIIPTMKPARRIPDAPVGPLVVEVWPDGNSRYRFFEDEGPTDFRLSEVRGGFAFEWSGAVERSIWLSTADWEGDRREAPNCGSGRGPAVEPAKSPRRIIRLPAARRGEILIN